MTFMDRNPVLLGIIAAAVIIGGTLAALAVQGGQFRTSYTVAAEFADAAGLRVGDHVLIAGIRAGSVTGLEIDGDQVLAQLQVNGHELPTQTRAHIVLRTLVGRRSVELVAAGDWTRLLADGDVIPRERTQVPIDVPEFGDIAERLLDEVDSEALNTFLASLTDVTRQQRNQVEALIAGGTRLTAVVNDQEQEVRQVLRDLRRVGEILNSRDAELVRIIDDFGEVVAVLAQRRQELQALFRETNAASATAADLVAATRADLDRILGEVHETSAVLARHQMDIAEALAYIGDSIEGFSSIAFAGGREVPWGHVFVTSLGPAGVDVLAGCGGLIDQQLDALLGPDPRSCEEQENQSWPDDVPPSSGGPVLPGQQGGAPPAGRAAPVPADVDVLLRRALRGVTQ
jgi:phospholipid/cholesterol/gamma-HCH transport system substrate-binding protein